MRTSGPVRRLVALLLLAVLAGTTQAPATLAQVSGTCSLSVDNAPVGDAGIRVADDAVVTISGTAPPLSTTEIFLSVLGGRIELAEARANREGIWSKTIVVGDYAKWGTGLYRLGWEPRDAQANGSSCSTEILVEGGFFGTPVAWVAAALLVGGGIGLIATLIATASVLGNRGGRWDAFVLANAAGERDVKGRAHFDVRYALRRTVRGMLWGFLAGLGALALCVGEAVGPPSVSMALSVVLPMAVAGALLGELRLLAERRLLRRLTAPPRRSRLRREALI